MVLTTVKLCSEDTDSRNGAENGQIEHQHQLIDNGNAGHLFRSHTPYHNIVQQSHKIGNAVLNHHGHCHT